MTAEQRLIDAVESAAAALGSPTRVVSEAGAALRHWATAELVLVGGDRAASMASVGPRRRDRVYLVGFEAGDLGTWSVPLGAGVIPLPQGLAWLSAVLAADTDTASRLVAVVGGSGGVGASTLAAGLALAGVRRGLATALVDLDPLGGGIDLVLGAERASGWRWPRLAGARGEVGDVRGVLPVVDGVTVVGMARGPDAGAPSAESVHAVLGSLGRHHALVVLDAGRSPVPAAAQAVRGAEHVALLAGTGVRAVAAASRTRAALDLSEAGVVVRTRGGGPPGEVVADALGAPLWGTVPSSRRLAADGEEGEPPGRRPTRWSRAVDRVLRRIWGEGGDVDRPR